VRNDPRGVTLPEDVARREANRVDNERQRAWKQRRWPWSAARAAMRVRGEEGPFESECLGADVEAGEDEEEGK
jgi:hypothetical protein